MSGWVKWEKDIETDPRFRRMVRKLRDASVTPALPERFPPSMIESLTVGGLVRFWSYADTHIRADDTLDLGLSDIDDLVGIPGFASVMPEDWLREIDDGSVELPGYQSHNGVEAKKRDLNQKRQERKRSRMRHAPVTPERDASGTEALPDQTRPDQKRPDQRREREARAREAGSEQRTEADTAGVIHTGDALTRSREEWRRSVPDVNAEKFAEWVVYLELKGKQLNPEQRVLQARHLAKQGAPPEQAEVVDWCVQQDYRTLIPLADVRARRDGRAEQRGRNGHGPQYKRALTTAELEAREVKRLAAEGKSAEAIAAELELTLERARALMPGENHAGH